MPVLQVERRNPQNLAAVQVSMANAAPIAELLAKLGSEDSPGVCYGTQSQTGSEFAAQGGWRITLTRPNYPKQFAYPGDWILVTDATHNNEDGWQLTDTSQAFIYGVSLGLAGTADDFTATFTEQGE